MEPHPHRHHYRLVIIVLFVCLAFIGIGLVFSYQRLGFLQKPVAVTDQLSVPTPMISSAVAEPSAPTVYFELVADSANTYTATDPFTMTIVASSYGNPVLGFDVLMSRDVNAYDVVSATSLLPEFTVLKFVKDDRVTVTGIMKLAETQPMIFDATPIASLVLRPKTQGTFDISVVPNIASESSKAISPDANGDPRRLLVDEISTLRVDID